MRHVDLARVVIELESPFAVGTGEGEAGTDATFVRDVDDLPTIPGTTLAGVLRAALPEEQANAWFGHQARARDAAGRRIAEGDASAVRVSFGVVHGADNRPVLTRGGADDAVLRLLRAGVARDHVRIGARGVADARGKFDELLVPAGARFTFELSHAREAGPSALDTLLPLLVGGGLRLGGHTRRGLGAFVVRAVRRRDFDLKETKDRAAWARLRSAFDQPDGLPVVNVQGIVPRLPEQVERRRFQLEAIGTWMFGGGQAVRPEHVAEQRQMVARKGQVEPPPPGEAAASRYETRQRSVDMVPYTEPRVSWAGDRGTVRDGALAEHPFVASGLKGALRHRAAFWARAADPDARIRDEGVGQPPRAAEPPEILWLFGHAGDETGQAGRVHLSESLAQATSYGRLDHVSLDRFTQGPMKGALYSEAPLYGGIVEIDLQIDLRRPGGDPGLQARALRVLDRALRDLAEGRLAVGAGAGRGHGFFKAVGPIPEVSRG